VSFTDEYGHFVLLGAGLVLLHYATRKKPRVIEEREGEPCEPGAYAPFGYDCVKVGEGYQLKAEVPKFIGYGPYPNRQAVVDALDRLGFPNENLAGFQRYMTLYSEWGLRTDGNVDRDTMLALREAELMLERNEWQFPEVANA